MAEVYYELSLKIPRWHKPAQIVHFSKDRRPTLVYTTTSLTRLDIPKYWSEWYAEDGTKNRNLMWIQSGNADKPSTSKSCQDLTDLPNHLPNREYVTVVMKGTGICDRIPPKYRVLTGKYASHSYIGAGKVEIHTPIWECDLETYQCKASQISILN